jgi:hydroxymethylpyrimidine pyrophosphatase-like HAD family hydrolase
MKYALQELELVESGDGSLRVIEKGKSKASTLSLFHKEGLIDLSHTIYVCDGENDVPPAILVKEHGGAVVAVSNATPKLKEIADVVAGRDASRGVTEVFSGLLNRLKL